MPENLASELTLVRIFVSEATAAASLLLSKCSGMIVPDEIIEVANETKGIVDDLSTYSSPPMDVLIESNWKMHIICSKLYLNIKRVARDKREQFSSAIKAYKNMMFHFSMGQMQLVPMEREQLLLDMGNHAEILSNSTQNEITRLIASGFTQRELAELLMEIGDITARLANNPLESIKALSASLAFFTDKLKQTAEQLDEPGDTLLYLADEYNFFISKISELSK